MLKNKFIYLLIIVMLLISVFNISCSSDFKYTKPASSPQIESELKIDKSIDQIYQEISQNFKNPPFTINNFDKNRSIIEITYTGDPEKYVNCGVINSNYKNFGGNGTFNISAAAAKQDYKYMGGVEGLVTVSRYMELTGKVNATLTNINESQTQVKIKSQYILEVDSLEASLHPPPRKYRNKITLELGQIVEIPEIKIFCVPTGKLEKDILLLLN